MISVSLCMIVKNEEDILARCLESFQELVDEIIVVDTGSEDGTKKIAARFTDKLYDFKWIGDFAAARNFAFSKASCDYIYSADADEVIDAENRQRFAALKEYLPEEVEIVQMYYGNQLAFGTIYNYDQEYRPKLFKRMRPFCWIEPIHETVRLEPVVLDSEIVITHLPKESHTARDLGVFERIVADGGKLSQRLHNLYAKELFVSGQEADFRQAEGYFAGTAMSGELSLDMVKEASCVAAKAARLRGDVAGFFKFALKDVGSEGSSEICCELGQYYLECGDFHEAVIWFYNAAFETPCILNVHCGGDIPLKGLAACYRQLNMPEQAAEYEQQAAEWKPQQ